jgi:hypothetical protein
MRRLVILLALAIMHSYVLPAHAGAGSTFTLEQRRATLRVRRLPGSLDNGTTPAVAIVFREGMSLERSGADTFRVLLAVWPDGQVAWCDAESTAGRAQYQHAKVPLAKLDAVIDRLAAGGVFDNDFSAYNFSVPDAKSYELSVLHHGRFLHIYMDTSFWDRAGKARFAGDPRASAFQEYVIPVRDELMALRPGSPPVN